MKNRQEQITEWSTSIRYIEWSYRRDVDHSVGFGKPNGCRPFGRPFGDLFRSIPTSTRQTIRYTAWMQPNELQYIHSVDHLIYRMSVDHSVALHCLVDCCRMVYIHSVDPSVYRLDVDHSVVQYVSCWAPKSIKQILLKLRRLGLHAVQIKKTISNSPAGRKNG